MQVQALRDCSKDIYHIHDMAGYQYTIEASLVSFQEKGDIPQLCTGIVHYGAERSGLDEESVDELKMSRNDLCEILYQKIKAQEAETEMDIDQDSDEMDASDADSESSENDDAEYSEDEDSGNEVHHKVPGIQVAARMGAARFQKN